METSIELLVILVLNKVEFLFDPLASFIDASSQLHGASCVALQKESVL